MKCAATCPWAPTLLCELVHGHPQVLHESDEVRWSDTDHTVGDEVAS